MILVINKKSNTANVKQLSEKQLSGMKTKQLQKCQALQQDLYRNANNFNNNEYCMQAIQNPNQFMLQNKTSLQNIPKSVRSDLVNVKQESNWSFKNIGSKLLKIGTVLTGLEFSGRILTGNPIYQDGNSLYNAGFLRSIINKTLSLIGVSPLYAQIDIKNVSEPVRQQLDTQWYMYISMAIFLFQIIPPIYRWIFKRNNDIKKQQYAQTTNLLKVTLDMLYESNDRYYLELSILNEAENIIISTKSTSKIGKLLKIVNKGIINLLKLSKGTEEALKNNSISCFGAALSNFLVSIGNIILVLAKGALLLLVSKEEKQKQEIEMKQEESKGVVNK